jgi:heme a synthase
MRISPARYRAIAIGALIALAVIIVSGAAVRLTNSGLGCDDWPQCNDQRLIDVSSKHAAIEQLNRLFTGIVGVAVIAAVLGSLRRVPRRSDLTTLSWWLVFGVLANAVIGGISVKVDLHPMWVQSHLLLSMFLIVIGTTLVRRAGEPDDATPVRQVDPLTLNMVRAHFALCCLAMFTGTIVTGAGPHAGDETAERLAIAIPTAARIHGVTVMLAIGFALVIGWRAMHHTQVRRALQHSLSTWIFVGVMQAAIGYVQYFNDVPALLVGIHVAGATAVMWASTVLLLDTRRAVPIADEALSAELVRT